MRIHYLTFLATLVLFQYSFGQSTDRVRKDSLIEICYVTSKSDTAKASAFTKLSSLYYQTNLDSVEIICRDGLSFISNLTKSSSKKKRIAFTKAEGILYMNAGSGCYLKGESEKALTYWYKCLAKKEKLKDDIGKANVLNNIANVQIDLGDIDKAEKSFKDILSIQRNIGDSAGIARTFNSLGYISRVNEDDSTALIYYRKSLHYRILLDNEFGIASCRNNIAFVYKKNEQFSKAIAQYKEALNIYTKLNANEGKATVLNNLANCYLELGQLREAKRLAQEGFAIATKLNLKIDLKYLNEVLYKIYKQSGKFSKALLHYEGFIELRDSLDSEKNYKALITQEAEYKEEQKAKIRAQEKEIERLKHDVEIKDADENAHRLRVIIISIGIILLIVILFVYLVYRQLKLAKAQKLIIESQNKEIEMKALRSQMNPHFLFNSLNSIKHFIIKNESEVAANYLSKFAKVIRLVLENSQHNLIGLDEELECLKNYLELEKLRFNDRFDYKITGAVGFDFIQLPPLILQPFIENAIWHGLMTKEGNDGLITINISEANNSIQITIEDNGIGRKKAQTLKSNGNIKKESMGLNITHNRLKALNKIIGIQSSIEIIDLYTDDNKACGTRVVLTIPYE